MVVVGSFFVVAGGIYLRVRGQGRPALNTLFLLGGALLGNIIGTTGASMLLIGNGPNLLVKAITDHAKIETPSFFGYAFKFAIPVLAQFSFSYRFCSSRFDVHRLRRFTQIKSSGRSQ
jgi:membrane-bound metal-dependent hydrolase YbcI (DUF457 family)